MDWPTFIASVPGSATFDPDYKSPNVKLGAFRSVELGQEQVKGSFEGWCKGHGGTVPFVTQIPNGGVAQAFYFAANAWANQTLAERGQRYSMTALVCLDGQSKQLTAAVLVRRLVASRIGVVGAEQPVVAFYSPSQAGDFADFYSAREKERSVALRKQAEERSLRQADETRRLRSSPKVGDQTNDGIIIELRPPLAQIQHDARMQQVLGMPATEWVPIASLTARY